MTFYYWYQKSNGENVYKLEAMNPSDWMIFHHEGGFYQGIINIPDHVSFIDLTVFGHQAYTGEDPTWDDSFPPPPEEEEELSPEESMKRLDESPCLSIPLDQRRYFRPSDVFMRLDGSVLRYKKQPVTIKASHGSLNVKLYALRDNEYVCKADSSDPDLDLESPPLGYVYWFDTTRLVFINRSPYRRQKQGLSSETVVSSEVYFKGGLQKRSRQGWYAGRSQLSDMIDGKYPDFDKVLYDLKTKDITGLPMSRDVALLKLPSTNYLILNRNVPVGVYFTKSKTGVLSEEPGVSPMIEDLSNKMRIDVDVKAVVNTTDL